MFNPHVLTHTPVDIVAALNLEVGKVYVLQCESEDRCESFMAVFQGDDPPEDNSKAGFKVPHLKTHKVKPVTGKKIYCWLPKARQSGLLQV